MSLTGFAQFGLALHALASGVVEDKARAAMYDGAERILERAKMKLGQSNNGWPPLKEETVKRRIRRGISIEGPAAPLLETGAMRDALRVISKDASSIQIGIPASDPTAARAVVHEWGSFNVPPRPFFFSSADELYDDIAERMGRALVIERV